MYQINQKDFENLILIITDIIIDTINDSEIKSILIDKKLPEMIKIAENYKHNDYEDAIEIIDKLKVYADKISNELDLSELYSHTEDDDLYLIYKYLVSKISGTDQLIYIIRNYHQTSDTKEDNNNRLTLRKIIYNIIEEIYEIANPKLSKYGSNVDKVIDIGDPYFYEKNYVNIPEIIEKNWTMTKLLYDVEWWVHIYGESLDFSLREKNKKRNIQY